MIASAPVNAAKTGTSALTATLLGNNAASSDNAITMTPNDSPDP